MTSGKPPPPPRQPSPEHDGNDDTRKKPREGGADMERREMMIRQTGSGPGEGEGLDARLQAQIGQKLKAMFDEVANAPIPDKFLSLLNQLDGLEKSK
jgi:Anti-sigma factor NepR